MKPRSLANFMFTGVVVIPATLIWLDEIGLALSTFIALLIAACLCGWKEQVDTAGCEASESDAADCNLPKPQSRDGPLPRRHITTDRDKPGMRQ